MRRHLNTLYVTTQSSYLSIEGETVLIKVERETKLRVPLHMLEGIICFGRVSFSPFLLGRCSERGIGISFLTERGRFLARIQGPISGNVLLRREQYRLADDLVVSAVLSKSFIAAKIATSRAVLQRAVRDHPDNPGKKHIKKAIVDLVRCTKTFQEPITLDRIRGIEGEAARIYFRVFNNLIVRQREDFSFNGRNRRPPMDNVNTLLSFVYTLLVHDVSSALEAVGLDPQVGYLHRDRPGRPGLALDLMEEFRAYLGDRLVLSLINRQQLRTSGFERRATGGVYMDDDTRKTVLVAYQERKQEEIRHPFLGEKTTVGMLVHLQARLFSRHLRGDLDAYPPFVWK